MDEIGVEGLFGEPGYTPREQTWARPTLEINGIWGGFQGEGIKTVLPNEAHAKITCRLVPGQDPLTIAQQITAHVERNTPAGVQVTTTRLGFIAQPYLIPADHPGNQAASAVLRRDLRPRAVLSSAPAAASPSAPSCCKISACIRSASALGWTTSISTRRTSSSA